MNLLFLDFETYYDAEYSLRRISIPQYILSPRFAVHMCACKVGLENPSKAIDGADFPRWLAQFDPAHTVTVTFNALFDASILAWKYGFVPNMSIDVLGMSRALLGHKLVRFNLNEVAAHFELGSKTGTLSQTLGLSTAEIKARGLWPAFCDYANTDNELCAGIFTRLAPIFPASERRLMDMVLRCAIQPRFHCDTGMLKEHLDGLQKEKAKLLAASGGDKLRLMSTPKFKEALEDLGVEVELKMSNTGRLTPAFARTDAFMEQLQSHDDTRVQALVAARLGLKSTIEESRTEKLLTISACAWPRNERLLPIPLKYGGAHTHRLSGDWKMNMQNMPTVRGSKGKSKLRKSLKAPPGHTVVVADLGQIEARLVAWICGAQNLVRQFANKEDPYSILACRIFGRDSINRKAQGTLDEIMGFIGKTGILGLGYGCGKPKFHTMVLRGARQQGMDISAIYTEEIGHKAVDDYRSLYANIPNGWYRLDKILRDSWLTGARDAVFGPCTIRYGQVILPNLMTLEYDKPREDENGELWYTYGRENHKIYGAKMLENIVQALARIVVMNAALRIRTAAKAPWGCFVLQAHDELVFIVPNAELEIAKNIIHTEMVRRPSWAPDLPLTADVGFGPTYGDAK